MQEHILSLVAHYGYVGIFAVLILGIVGVPVPDEFLLTFAGYLVTKGELTYIWTLLTAFLGSVTGMSISFWIGHRLGYPFLHKYGRKIHITPERLQKVEAWFHRFGKFTIIIGYFIPGVRHFTAYFAGISKWSYRTFLSFAIPGGFLWVATFITLGRYMGEHWRRFSEILHRNLLILVFAVIIGILLWLVIRNWLNKRKGI